MTTNLEDHPRAAEAWEAAKFMGEMAAAEARQTWEANEAYRREHEAELLAEVTAAMRAEDRSEEEIERVRNKVLNEPNAFWGELREGRLPPLDM